MKSRFINKYMGILILMVFFLIGYAATLFFIINLESIDTSMFLVSIIFFFGAVFCFSVVFVQSELLNRLELNATELRKALANSTDANTTLEHLNTELVSTMDTLKSTQRQLVFSEKMSTLGRMMAGISHEINTPLGVIKASAQSMETSFSEEQFGLLLTDIHALTGDDFGDFLHFLSIAVTGTKKNLSTSEMRALKREARNKLSEVEGFDDLTLDMLARNALLDADTLSSIGPRLASDSFKRLLFLMNKVVVMIISIDNINISSEKIGRIISSMKSFSHVSAGNEKTTFNIIHSLETVLSIFTNQLKYDFKVITNFETVPDMEGYEDELNQVWSNLIQNAVHAMQDACKGSSGEARENTLTINVNNMENDCICVSISDNGSGIDKDKQSDIFEPFFTTKPTGIGTGLGLSISKQIIDKHNGSIRVESEPDRGTTFTITLPLLSPQPSVE